MPSLPDFTGMLHLLLEKRNLAAPDGRPLYAYRFSQEEYDRVGNLLASGGRTALRSAAGHALLVMRIAEWFRRDRVGGHWDWIRPLATLGLHYGSSGPVTYQDIQYFVSGGLRYWRRPPPRGGERILAIVRESGFPVAAIREDPRIGSWLRNSVLCSERGFGAGEATVAEAWRVSTKIAEALYDAAVDLTTAIVALRSEVPDSERRSDPVAWLDAERPSWREDLPFDVACDDVRALVEQMMRLREGSAAGLDIVRRLVRLADGKWLERATLELEGLVDRRRLPPTLIEAMGDGRRIRLFPRPPFSEELVAIAAIEPYNDDGELVFELRPFVIDFEVPLPLDREARLLAQAGHETVGEFVPSGGQAFTDPILAFAIEDGGDDRPPTVLRLLGASSCRTARGSLVLAIDPKIRGDVQFSGPTIDIGRDDAGRQLLQFSGTARATQDGTILRWITAAEQESDAKLFLVGDLVPRIRETVFAGMPRIWIESEGHVIEPRRDKLRTRPRGRGAWTPLRLSAERWGSLEIGYFEDDELKLKIHADVIPAMAQAHFNRVARQLRLSGLSAPMLGARGSSPLVVERDGDDHVVILGPATSASTITIRPRWENEVVMTFADPGHELRLADDKDVLLAPRQKFALDGLGGCHILASRAVSLGLALDAPDAPPLAIWRQVGGDIPLGALRDTIRHLLGSSQHLDARVVLYAVGQGDNLAEIRWYAEEIDPFAAIPASGPFAILSSAFGLDLRALSLADPAAGAVDVAPNSQQKMRGELAYTLPEGPWLIFGRRRNGPTARPRILPADTSAFTKASPFVEAVRLDDSARRQHALKALFENELEPEDVTRLIALFVRARSESVPLSAIDAFRMLIRAPAAAVALLAECDKLEERAALLELQRDLPFLWCATPVAVWIDAFGTRCERVRERLDEAGIDTSLADQAILKGLGEIVSLRPELAGHARAVYLAVIAARANGETIDGSSVAFLKAAGNRTPRGEIDRMIARRIDGDLRPGLLPEHVVRSQEPHWSPFDTTVSELIAAPFAVVEHAAGISTLDREALDRCRDAALFDPEFFEAMVPLALDEISTRRAQAGGRVP